MVQENQRQVDLALVLSNPSSMELTVQISENKSSCQTANSK